MLGPDALLAFYLALDESPGDRVTLLALADWYDEQGKADHAECLRWTIKRGHFPFRCHGLPELPAKSDAWHPGWFWWALDGNHHGQAWGHPASCRLPGPLWDRLRHTFTYTPAVFKEYPSLREAYEALFAAWPLAPQPLLEPAPGRRPERRR